MALSAYNSGVLVAVGDNVRLNVTGLNNMGVQLTGTFVGTVHFKGSVDGIGFADAEVSTLADPTVVVTTATAPGIWQFSAGALLMVEVVCSAYTSGTIDVSIVAGGSNKFDGVTFNVSNPADGDVLTYDAASSTWVNADALVLGGSLTATDLIGSSMPTIDPHVVGQLWNSSGVVHVSAG